MVTDLIRSRIKLILYIKWSLFFLRFLFYFLWMMLFDWVFNCSVVIADKQNDIIGWKKTIKDHESWLIPFVNPFRYLKYFLSMTFFWRYFRYIRFFLMLLMHEWERSYVIFWLYMVFFKGLFSFGWGKSFFFFVFLTFYSATNFLHSTFYRMKQ